MIFLERKRVIDLVKGDKINDYFLIKEISCKLTNGSNNKFLDIDLLDNTGMINAKLWECRNNEEETLKNNMLVKVSGSVLEWKGKLQIKADSIRPISEEDHIDVKDFIPVAPFEAQEMYDEILSYIFSIDNEDIKNIAIEILNEYDEKLMYYPAAKSNHHSIKSGLLYHTVTMLKLADNFINIYKFLNKDLLYAGIVLHDIAKIEEMDSSDLGIVSEYTIAGQLLGHITLGINKIQVVGEKIKADKEVIMLLQHMILSHHYEPEFGSPKKPMIPEAEILHFLDIIDARMYDMNKALSEINPGEFTDKIWSLDNLRIYKSKL